jgi:excinuclease UvrABC nuclease subunit
MQDAAEKLLFEEAQFLKERYLELKKVLGSGERQVSSINSNNCVLLTGIDGGKAEVFFVRFGRLLKQSVLTQEQLPLLNAWFQKQLRNYYATSASAIPPECGKPEIDEMRILAMWIERSKRDQSSTLIYVNEEHAHLLPKLSAAARTLLGAPLIEVLAPEPAAIPVAAPIAGVKRAARTKKPVAAGITFTPERLETARRITIKPMYPKR